MFGKNKTAEKFEAVYKQIDKDWNAFVAYKAEANERLDALCNLVEGLRIVHHALAGRVDRLVKLEKPKKAPKKRK